ncbi:MAG: hypothetical protein RLZZ59_233 [Pseudomonadota bacterium]|jgi:putative endonuclease
MRKYAFGLIAEYLISLLYLLKLYKIIGHRVKTKLGEIDLICKRGKTIVFIEVKARSSEYDELPCRSQQQKRIRNAAILFLQKNRRFDGYDIRFDLCIIRPYKFPHVIKNAW